MNINLKNVKLNCRSDTNQILKKWNTPLAKKIKFILKYYKLPAPTIQFFPKINFFPFFM